MKECKLWDKVANGIGRVSVANRCQIEGPLKTELPVNQSEQVSARVKQDIICEELTSIHSKIPEAMPRNLWS